MSTLYRCDTCGKLSRHCASHSREIAPPVVLRGVPGWYDERTFCSVKCFLQHMNNNPICDFTALESLPEKATIPTVTAMALVEAENGRPLPDELRTSHPAWQAALRVIDRLRNSEATA